MKLREWGSEAMLMMTWGRCSGDPTHPTIYSNFTNMQDRLEDGYTDYHDNMTVRSRDMDCPSGSRFQEYLLQCDGFWSKSISSRQHILRFIHQ